MAKICIATFADTSDNYGQVLQYLATQEYLRLRGHDPYLLISKGHRLPLHIRFINKLKKKLFPIKEIILSKDKQRHIDIYRHWDEIAAKMEVAHPRNFNNFRKQNFKILFCFLEDVQKYNFDAYAVGSDQTWGNYDDTYFLNWAPKGALRFAFAPSIAHKQYTNEEINLLKPIIKQFSFVTVREYNGLEFCRRINYKDAKLVLDPTFLLSSAIYNNFIPNTKVITKPYLLLYLLGNEIAIDVQQIFLFAKSKEIEVKYVASQGRDDNFPKVYPEVGEWLGLIKNATFIITNSFHGMAFSVIYHKSFMVLPIVGIFKGMNVRIETIASLFNLQNRIFRGKLELIEEPIDWTQTDKVIFENKNILDKLMSQIGL